MPTQLSAVICVTLAAATLVLNQVAFIKEYLQLPDGLQVFQTVTAGVDAALTSTIGESNTSVLVVGAFWAIVGLGVYLFLRGVAQYITELDDDIEVRRYVWPKGADRSKPLRVTAERTIFRALALVGLIMVVFGPLADTLKGPVFYDLVGPSDLVVDGVWFVASLLLWHLVVVLLRLLTLKVRLIDD